jgi:uncharacterized delta-60 repeat protein
VEIRTIKTPLSYCIALAAAVLSLALFTAGLAMAAMPFYGNHGRVLTAIPGEEVRGAGIASYGGGKVIVAATSRDGIRTRSWRDDDEDFVLARYLSDGALDRSFGNGGIVRTDLGGDERATDIKVDRFGRILLTGYDDDFRKEVRDDEALVARYMPNGRLDASFGDGGIVRAGRGGAFAVAVDRANHVLIAGGTTLNSPLRTEEPWRVVRLTYDGRLDPSFGGGDGEATGTGRGYATDLTVDLRGRVILAICGLPGPRVFAVATLQADGSVDTSFGEGGLVEIGFDGDSACPDAISRDRQGRIVVAGDAKHQLLVARLGAGGLLDPSFAGTGTVSLLFPEAPIRLGRIAIDGHSRIILAGRIAPSFERLFRGARYPARMLLVGFRADGSRDRRFGGDGDVAIRFGPGMVFDSEAADVAIFRGSVYAAGAADPRRASSPSSRIALARYSMH